MTSGSTTAVAVHLEHVDHPGVRFTVMVDSRLRMCGVEVAPLRWVPSTYDMPRSKVIGRDDLTIEGAMTIYTVDASPAAGLDLSATFLRAVNWGELHRAAQRDARSSYGWLSAASPGSQWALTVAKGEGRRPGRPGHGDAYYARLAARYVELLEGGDPTPIVTMAEELGESRKFVAEQISRCRPRGHGMLTETRRGTAGGELTDKALAVLAELDD